MKNKKRNALFRELREEAKRINAWEARELIQQAQTAFNCADEAFSEKSFNKQLKKIDKFVAKIRSILPKSKATNSLESERRLYQSAKDSSNEDLDSVESAFCWCADDD
ncbi:MAG: hypothetical protein K5873_11485 [Treponema sp.]|nr:hypothetical protein [Treponema sp.]